MFFPEAIHPRTGGDPEPYRTTWNRHPLTTRYRVPLRNVHPQRSYGTRRKNRGRPCYPGPFTEKSVDIYDRNFDAPVFQFLHNFCTNTSISNDMLNLIEITDPAKTPFSKLAAVGQYHRYLSHFNTFLVQACFAKISGSDPEIQIDTIYSQEIHSAGNIIEKRLCVGAYHRG